MKRHSHWLLLIIKTPAYTLHRPTLSLGGNRTFSDFYIHRLRVSGPSVCKGVCLGGWAGRCVWPAESHIREEPLASGLSHTIFNLGARHFCTAGVTASFEALFFFLWRECPSNLGWMHKPEPRLWPASQSSTVMELTWDRKHPNSQIAEGQQCSFPGRAGWNSPDLKYNHFQIKSNRMHGYSLRKHVYLKM